MLSLRSGRVAVGLAALALFSGCSPKAEEGASAPKRVASGGGVANGGGEVATDTVSHLALGSPTPLPSSQENYFIDRPQYFMSYASKKGQPNWVSWHLGAKDLGDVDRGKFRPDPDISGDMYQVTPKDYTNTGYDRGHICPSADRTATTADNDATFLMSNIMPQAPGNNQGPWKALEDYSRDLVKQGEELYIVAGGGGKTTKKIAGGKVTVPKFTWKAIVVLPDQAGDDLARITAETRVIAIIIPNQDNVRNKDWKKYRVAARDIEKATNYNLFSKLSQEVQDAIETKVDAE